MAIKFVFLSQKFHNDYPLDKYPEFERKPGRPYLVVIIRTKCCGTFAVPLRHHITHNFSFLTDKIRRCGLDYSKAVPLENNDYIQDLGRQVLVEPAEYQIISARYKDIVADFELYLQSYKRAVMNKQPGYLPIRKYSTLQYFHKELGLPQD
jgi:protein AbiQ